jgi:hypothetical protein
MSIAGIKAKNARVHAARGSQQLAVIEAVDDW